MSTRLVIPHKPLPGQLRFHKSPAFLKLARGGVGSGKTKTGAAESVKLAVKNRGCDGMVVAPTSTVLYRATLRTYISHLPDGIIKRHHKGERYIELIDGTRTYYGTADRPDTLEGSNLAWGWGDELRYWPQQAWTIFLARVREPAARRLAMILTTTPTMGWLYDQFGRMDKADPRRFETVLRSDENPFLPPEYLEELKRTYSAELYQQYCLGEWVLLSGAVYGGAFHHEESIRGYWIDHDKPVHVGLDFGLTPAVVFAQEKGDRLYVIDQLAPGNNDVTTPQLAALVRQWFKDNKLRPGELWCDPAGKARDPQTGISQVRCLEEFGFDVRYCTDSVRRSVRYGIDLVRARLSGLDGARRLFLTRDLHVRSKDDPRGLVAGFRGYRYSDKVGVEDPVKDGVVDHMMDALRYLIVGLYGEALGASVDSLWGFIDRKKERTATWTSGRS